MNEMSNMGRAEKGRRTPNGGIDTNSQISRKLREFYDSVQEERLPDRFLDLLEKLDEAEKAAKSATKPGSKE